MVYKGSKNRLSKYIKPFIQNALNYMQLISDKKDDVSYIEPFVGGANMIDKIEWKYKYGLDNNENLIWFLIKMKEHNFEEWVKELSEIYTKEEYYNLKKQNINKSPEEQDEKWKVVGITHCFRGKVYESCGYLDGKKKNEQLNNVIKQSKNELFKNTMFICNDFKKLVLTNSVIYLDPPYLNTESYTPREKIGEKFKQELINKIEEWHSSGNIILFSEKTIYPELSNKVDILLKKEIYHLHSINKQPEYLILYNPTKDKKLLNAICKNLK